MSTPKKFVVHLEREDAKKHSVRYKPTTEAGAKIIGIQYVPNETLAALGNPDNLTLVIIAGTHVGE